jgi:hypothetical protein
MGGGGDEDDRRELERLERDLAAIDARWSAEGYQQRTSSKVLDDERTTRRELTRRIAQLRGLPPPLTPAAGTVALNVGGAWRPLAVAPAPSPSGTTLPLPRFDVETEDEPPPPLSELEESLHTLLIKAWDAPQWWGASLLPAVTKRFQRTPGASRLLGAAWSTIGRKDVAAQFSPPAEPIGTIPPVLIEHPLLMQATELPDEISGLTLTQTALMRALRQIAPETGPFVRAGEAFVQLQGIEGSIDEPTFTREVSKLGHPSLRMLPLVAFQGFTGRFTAAPSFTHVRLTPIGREVIDGAFPLPNLLANGASGAGACLWPMATAELAKAALSFFETRAWPRGVYAFDFPDGTRSHAPALVRALAAGARTELLAKPEFELQLSASERRCRVIVRAFPWPRVVADVLPALERLLAAGRLDGVLGFTDESSADAVRLAVEVEHVVFLRAVEEKLRNCGLFDAQYRVEPRVRTVGPLAHPVPGLTDLLAAFLESRKEAAVKRLDADVLKFKVAAQRAEAVCVALEMMERVQSVLRDALSDAEAESGLMRCMRLEDRSALERLPFPASHDYAQGFTLEQARHLAKKKRLAATVPEFARTDWARALEDLEAARRTLSDRGLVMRLVREELLAANTRFAAPRRGRMIF